MAVKTAKFIWMDGKLVKWNEAKVHILTHALHYGSAVFEGIHSYKTDKGTAVFRLSEHVERLFYSASAFGMKLGFTKGQLKNAIKRLVKANNLGDSYIRPLIYYGYGGIEVYPKNIPASTAVIAMPLEAKSANGLRVFASKYAKPSEKSTAYGAKISGSYANSILAMHEARKKGYDEALMLDEHGFVSEGPAENVFIVKNESFIMPESRSALPGITMESIAEASKGMGVNACRKKVTLAEIKDADEAFFCGTLAGIVPIISLNDKKIGNGKAGKLTLKIKDKFYGIVRGKDKKYIKWLTYVD